MRREHSTTVRDYILDLAKIVEGAVAYDHEKVLAYVQQLSERLEANGEREAAKRIRRAADGSKARKVGLARGADGNGASAGLAVPADSDSRMPLADETLWERGDVKVVLEPPAQRLVEQFLTYYRVADRLVANGVGVSASMLMHGPPGCGKTQLARYIAAELGLPLVTARADGLISSYLGNTAKNIRMLFEFAASHPCVLFLDEFDAVAKMRDDSHELGELKRVVISLLQNIDAIDREHVLLAATNHEHLLDPAIWRRFAYRLKLTEPASEPRAVLLRHFLGSFADDGLIEILVALTDGASGAQLRDVAEDAVRAAVVADKPKASVRDAALAALSLSAEGDSLPRPYTVAEQVRALRGRNPKVFTQVRLAEIFGLSQSQVSKLLAKGGNHA